MRPTTETIPKAMIPVSGRPFASWQLELLARNGVKDVVYAVGHLGEQIEAFVGDGLKWGIAVRYSYEAENLLGTAGAIRLACDRGLLQESFFVLYGDSYLPVEFESVSRSFHEASEPALMTVFENAGRFGPSNAVLDGGKVILYDKRPGSHTPDMRFIDFGLSAFDRRVIIDHTEPGTVRDLSDVQHELSLSGELAGYEVRTRFYEVGSPEGLHDLETHLQNSADPGATLHGLLGQSP